MSISSPLRILLAEDNLVNQKVAIGMLKRLGYQADLARNGQAAVDAVQTQVYDVILMDVHMPQLDGLEATREIRATLPAERQPFIIALTADTMEEDRQACLDAGMDAHTQKPIRLDELKTLLQNVTPLTA